MLLNNWLISIKAKLYGNKVGVDEFGNQYYIIKNKRFVYYNNNDIEAQNISPLWHGWLHYYRDDIPTEIKENSKTNQKKIAITHVQNQIKPYEAWNPNFYSNTNQNN